MEDDFRPLEKNEYIVLVFYTTYYKPKSYNYYSNFDEYQLKEDFEVEKIYKFFDEKNRELHCVKYLDKSTERMCLIVSNNLEELEQHVIEIGLNE